MIGLCDVTSVVGGFIHIVNLLLLNCLLASLLVVLLELYCDCLNYSTIFDLLSDTSTSYTSPQAYGLGHLVLMYAHRLPMRHSLAPALHATDTSSSPC